MPDNDEVLCDMCDGEGEICAVCLLPLSQCQCDEPQPIDCDDCDD